MRLNLVVATFLIVFSHGIFSLSAQSTPASVKAVDRLVLWDGDTITRDAGGWSGPNSAINTLQVTSAQAHGGQNSLHWHGEGSGLVGAAWNFFNYQKDSSGPTGFDISGYANLRLWLKVSAEPGKEPSGFSITLSSAANRRSSLAMNLDEAVKQSLNGQWCEVVIPLETLLPKADSTTPAARRFDPKTVWEIGVSSWSSDERRFDVYIDDISVDAPIKTTAPKPKAPKPKAPKPKAPKPKAPKPKAPKPKANKPAAKAGSTRK